MSVLERLKYHREIKKMDKSISTPILDAVIGGAKVEAELGPTDRIKLHREREALARADKENK